MCIRDRYAHFKAINDSVDLPIFIYNIPGRSVVDMSVETMAELAKLPNIIGTKDASNDLVRPTLLRNALEGKEFIQFSGEDPSLLPFMAAGGDGIISVTANIVPNLMSKFCNLWKLKKIDEARSIQESLMDLHSSLFIETSPAPVKYAASLMGLCEENVRLPLVNVSDNTSNLIKSVMENMQLISKS